MEPIETSSDAWSREIGALRAMARALIADEHAAEDALQDTWLRARCLDADGAGAALRRPGAWLATILRNLARDRRRAEARRGEERAASELAAALPSPAEVAERLELTQRIVAALAALPEPYRTTLHLHYFEGASAAEIARRAGLPLETVRTRVRRGLARMRAELDRGDERGAWCAALAALAAPTTAAPSSAPPLMGGTTLVPLAGTLVMSKAWIGAASAFVLVAGLLYVSSGSRRDARPEPAVASPPPALEAPAEVLANAVTAERSPVEAPVLPGASSTPVTSTLVPVRGRVLVVDPSGVEHASESGELRLVVAASEAGQEVRELAVERGGFELAVAPGSRLRAVGLAAGGRTALLEDGPSGAFAGPDPIDVPAALEPFELVVRARWTVDVLLHVAAEGVDELTGVEVRRRTHWRAIGPALHPGDAREVSTVASDAASPVALPDPGQGLRLVPYWVRAPGLAWRRIDIDHDAGGEHTVRLAPGGALELRAAGVLPEGELFLRLFAPGGDAGWSFEAQVEITVGRDGRARIDDLRPGRYAARLDQGSFAGALALARGTVTVAAGATAWLDLAVDAAALAPRRVHLTGTLTLPPGFSPGRHELHLDVEPREPGQAQVRLPLARMAPAPGEPGVLAWDAGQVLPAHYLASVTEVMHRELVDARAGDEPTAHLVLPPLARVSVAIVDAATGAALERARLTWADGELDGVHNNAWAKVLRERDSGRFVLTAPHGAVQVQAEAPEYVRVRRTLELTGDLELELVLERASGVELAYYDGDTRLPIALEVEGLQVLDPETGASLHEHVLDMRVDARERRVILRPGKYELRFAQWPEPWEPLAPIVVEIPAQGLIELRVPVRRR